MDLATCKEFIFQFVIFMQQYCNCMNVKLLGLQFELFARFELLAGIEYLHILALFHSISLRSIIIIICVNCRTVRIGSCSCICHFMALAQTARCCFVLCIF